jgi:hypothetical protein
MIAHSNNFHSGVYVCVGCRFVTGGGAAGKQVNQILILGIAGVPHVYVLELGLKKKKISNSSSAAEGQCGHGLRACVHELRWSQMRCQNPDSRIPPWDDDDELGLYIKDCQIKLYNHQQISRIMNMKNYGWIHLRWSSDSLQPLTVHPPY